MCVYYDDDDVDDDGCVCKCATGLELNGVLSFFFDVSFRFTVFRFERCFVFVLNGPNCTMAF